MKWFLVCFMAIILFIGNATMWAITYDARDNYSGSLEQIGVETTNSSASNWAFGSTVTTLISVALFATLTLWAMYVDKDTRKY